MTKDNSTLANYYAKKLANNIQEKVNNTLKKLETQQLETIKLLKSVDIDYSILMDNLKIADIFNNIEALDNNIINAELVNLFGYNNETNLYRNQHNKRTIKNVQIKEVKDINTFSNFEFNKNFSLRSTHSEQYLNKFLYDDKNMNIIKPEVTSVLNYRTYSVEASVKAETIKIKMNQFKTIFKSFKNIKIDSLKFLGYYYLLSSGIFNPFDTTENNLERLKALFLSKEFNNDKIELINILNIRYFRGDGEESTNPLWKITLNQTTYITSIGQFCLSEKNMLCNVFIDVSYRGMKYKEADKDKSILDTIFESAIETSKKEKCALYITTKNKAMLHTLMKYNFKIIGAKHPPFSYVGYTLPNEIVAVFDINDSESDYILNFINEFNPDLFLANEGGFDISEINYKEIIEERYKRKAENFEYIGITTSFLARKLLDVNTLEEVSQPTILLFKDDELYSIPLIKIDLPDNNYLSLSNLTDTSILKHFKYNINLEILIDNDIDIVFNEPDSMDILREVHKDDNIKKLYPKSKKIFLSLFENIKGLLKHQTNSTNNPESSNLDKFLFYSKFLFGYDLFAENYKKANNYKSYKVDLGSHVNTHSIIFNLYDGTQKNMTIKELFTNSYNLYKNGNEENCYILK